MNGAWNGGTTSRRSRRGGVKGDLGRNEANGFARDRVGDRFGDRFGEWVDERVGEDSSVSHSWDGSSMRSSSLGDGSMPVCVRGGPRERSVGGVRIDQSARGESRPLGSSRLPGSALPNSIPLPWLDVSSLAPTHRSQCIRTHVGWSCEEPTEDCSEGEDDRHLASQRR